MNELSVMFRLENPNYCRVRLAVVVTAALSTATVQ